MFYELNPPTNLFPTLLQTDLTMSSLKVGGEMVSEGQNKLFPFSFVSMAQLNLIPQTLSNSNLLQLEVIFVSLKVIFFIV